MRAYDSLFLDNGGRQSRSRAHVELVKESVHELEASGKGSKRDEEMVCRLEPSRSGCLGPRRGAGTWVAGRRRAGTGRAVVTPYAVRSSYTSCPGALYVRYAGCARRAEDAAMATRGSSLAPRSGAEQPSRRMTIVIARLRSARSGPGWEARPRRRAGRGGRA